MQSHISYLLFVMITVKYHFYEIVDVLNYRTQKKEKEKP